MALPPISKNALAQVIEVSQPVYELQNLTVRVTDEDVMPISNLLQAMQATEFMSPFDWQAEFGDNPEHLTDVERIQSADLETLRKMMTAHVRLDRMSDGHLHSLIDNGYWKHCLSRMEELYSEMDE